MTHLEAERAAAPRPGAGNPGRLGDGPQGYLYDAWLAHLTGLHKLAAVEPLSESVADPKLTPERLPTLNRKRCQSANWLYNAQHRQRRPGGETGRRTGLKIPGPERDVAVRLRPRAPEVAVEILRPGNRAQDFACGLPLWRRAEILRYAQDFACGLPLWGRAEILRYAQDFACGLPLWGRFEILRYAQDFGARLRRRANAST